MSLHTEAFAIELGEKWLPLIACGLKLITYTFPEYFYSHCDQEDTNLNLTHLRPGSPQLGASPLFSWNIYLKNLQLQILTLWDINLLPASGELYTQECHSQSPGALHCNHVRGQGPPHCQGLWRAAAPTEPSADTDGLSTWTRLVSKVLPYFSLCSITVDIQCCAAQCLNIYIVYKVTLPTFPVPTWFHT